MTRPIQKIEEQNYANLAAKLLKENWQISEPENELDWPDLLVKNGDKYFGLEVRKVFKDEKAKGSLSRTDESIRIDRLQSSAIEFYKTFSCSVKVQLYGDPGNPLELAKCIGIAANSLKEWGRVKVRLGNQRWMYVCRLPDDCEKYTRWDLLSDTVGWVGTIGSDCIQKAIHSKAKKLAKYKRNLSVVDLLLVCDHTKNSGKNNFGELEKVDTEGFDRIYLMTYPSNIIKLPAQK